MDRPILFSAPMVRAILAGRKTMTRRVTKPKFDKWQVGDRLWVRETYVEYVPLDKYLDPITDEPLVAYRADGNPEIEEMLSEAKDKYLMFGEDSGFVKNWCPSIFMPRKYSRILLEITELKRERLQDISEADAKREGVEPEGDYWGGDMTFISYQNGFRSIWEQINGRDSWKQNPEVVAIGFKVLETKGGVCE